jgi:hypothetical protein
MSPPSWRTWRTREPKPNGGSPVTRPAPAQHRPHRHQGPSRADSPLQRSVNPSGTATSQPAGTARRQPHESVSSSRQETAGTAQQAPPRHASLPSFTAAAAMASAATGSAHHQPNRRFASRPTSSTANRQVYTAGPAGNRRPPRRSRFPPRPALGRRQDRHDHQRQRGEHDTADGCSCSVRGFGPSRHAAWGPARRRRSSRSAVSVPSSSQPATVSTSSRVRIGPTGIAGPRGLRSGPQGWTRR